MIRRHLLALALAGAGQPPRRVLGLPRVRETLQQKRDGDRHAAPFAVPLNRGLPDLSTLARSSDLARAGQGR